MASADELHFRKILWCANLINDPAWTPCNTSSRQAKGSTEDSFFAETLRSDRTIRKLLSMHRKAVAEGSPAIQEVRTLMDLGNGVNGHPDICHGGFVATMLDEVIGVLLTLNLGISQGQKHGESVNEPMRSFTAYLKVNYKKPLRTPGVVLCTAKFERSERNKTWVVGTVEDGQGTVFATGEALFVEPRSKL